MHILLLLLGLLIFGAVLQDSFQTIILPRRPVARFRLTRIFFLVTWIPWTRIVHLYRDHRRREQLYSFYGPLSLLMLFVFWAISLITAFALIYFGLHAPFLDPWHPTGSLGRLRSCFYVSGSTLFTLGLGDVIPSSHFARFLIILEAGTGLGFVALVIGYVPVLYGAFSARETEVALLDARAGSPPTAGELLLRHHFQGGEQALTVLLAEWERWSATMLETHISYPILCYYRSQHDNQSWLSALTAVLDACALLITAVEGPAKRQAQLTFAVGRHVLVDIGHVFHREKAELRLRQEPFTRLNDEEFARLTGLLYQGGISLCSDTNVRGRLDALRRLYEPSACAMAHYLRLELPHWMPPPPNPAKPDIWTSIDRLRSPSAPGSLTSHVSPQAAASGLGDDEGFL
ncbi:MAG TPA: potassium channel family protein [Candidatus Aquilonibacter sp.]|nr:potassium channel family protein [Candidatus Aquilonibacter sp.]